MSDRTYEIRFIGGPPKRVTIPDTWKVTFGSVVPGKSAGALGLRLWEGTDKQRAVFTNVESFRDVSIPVQVAAIRKFGTKVWYADDGRAYGLEEGEYEQAWMDEHEAATERPEWATDETVRAIYAKTTPY